MVPPRLSLISGAVSRGRPRVVVVSCPSSDCGRQTPPIVGIWFRSETEEVIPRRWGHVTVFSLSRTAMSLSARVECNMYAHICPAPTVWPHTTLCVTCLRLCDSSHLTTGCFGRYISDI